MKQSTPKLLVLQSLQGDIMANTCFPFKIKLISHTKSQNLYSEIQFALHLNVIKNFDEFPMLQFA